jgi:hypothetical protein
VLLAVTVVAASFCVLVGPAAAHTPHDSISDVELSPSYSRDGKVFAVAASRLLVGDGISSTWTQVVRGLPRSPEAGQSIARIAIAPSDARIMYLSSRLGGVFRSDDGGASWRAAAAGIVRKDQSSAQADVTPIAVSPRDPNVVLAGGSLSGLFRTSDGGAHWQSISGFRRVVAITFVATSGLAIVADGAGRLLVSTDDGKTWTQVAGANGGAFSVIASSPTDESVFAGTTKGALFMSRDGGLRFVRIGSGLPQEVVVGIAMSPKYSQDQTLWISTYKTGVYRSTDGGKSWRAAANGLTTDPQADLVHVAQFRNITAGATSNGGIVLFEAGFDTLFRSTDEGAHWYRVETLGDYIVGLAVSPNFAHDSTVAVASYIKGAYLSTDAGAHFDMIDSGLGDELAEGNKFAPVRRLHNIVFSPDYARDHTIFSATWTAFLKSTNGGQSWSQIQVDPAGPSGELRQFVIGIAPDYQNSHTIFLGTRQGEIFRSDGAGAKGTWHRVTNLRVRVRSLAFDPSYPTQSVLFAGTEHGIFKGTNGATTWTKVKNVVSGETLLAISPGFDTDHTIFAATAGGLLVSRDSGVSWSTASLPSTSVSTVEAVALSPDFVNDQTVLASVGGVGLFKSTNAGRSFAAVGADLLSKNLIISDFTNPTGTALQFSPAFAHDHTVFAYAEQSVVRSTDGGITWTVLAMPSALNFLRIDDPTLLNRYGTAASAPAHNNSHTALVIVVIVTILAVVLLSGVLYFARSRRRNGVSQRAAPENVG